MNGLAPFITPIVYQRFAPVYQTLLVGLVGLLGGDSNGPLLGAISNATGGLYEFVDINDQRPTQQANHKMQELFTRITSAIAKNVRVSLTPRGGGIERIEVLGIDQGGFHQDPNGRVTVSLTSIERQGYELLFCITLAPRPENEHAQLQLSLSYFDVVENKNAIQPNLRVIIQRTATAPHPPKLFHSSKQSRVNVLREACRFFDEKNIEKGREILLDAASRALKEEDKEGYSLFMFAAKETCPECWRSLLDKEEAQLHWHFKDSYYDSLDKDCKK